MKNDNILYPESLEQFRREEQELFYQDENGDKARYKATPISDRTALLMLSVINDLEKEANKVRSAPKFSMYNLAHNEVGDCCGVFDRMDSEGMVYCNECNQKLRDVVLSLVP